jgi:type I restriction enzyme S subunit
MIIERKSIPKDWDLISVEDCFDILDNQRKPLNESERNLMRGDIPYYGANGVVDYVNEFLFDDDLILIAEDGGYFDEFQTRPISYKVKGKAWINNHAHVLKAKNGYYQDYLFYCLEHKNILIWLNGGTRAKLNKGDLEKLPIQIAPLPEQKAITQVLSTADDAIHTTEKLIAQKELRKKWLMQQLLTGKKRLKGFGGEWKENKLSDLFDRVTRKNTEGNTTVVTISAQRGFVRQTDFFNKNIASEITDNYFLVERGEFCYNKSYSNGYPWGATKRLNDFEKAVVTTLYICFGVKDEKKTNPQYFEQYFGANHLDKGLTKIAYEGGRAHGLLNVTPSDFFSLKVTVPSYVEQTAIAQVLQAADKEISLLKAKAEKLREQKKGLMQQLLTGKVRLKI